MLSAVDPLDLPKHSARCEKSQSLNIDAKALKEYLQGIVRQAANLINADVAEKFLYKNPNGSHSSNNKFQINRFEPNRKRKTRVKDSYSSPYFVAGSSSTSGENNEKKWMGWSSIENFEFHTVVREIKEFIQTWELSPSTKFVVIAVNKTKNRSPFGSRYWVEVHFSKPTIKCPNPLAVARVYFQINVSHLLPKDYPVNVTYKFEGCKSEFYAMGERKPSSNKFQRYYIDSTLCMKLAFYDELRKQSDKLVTLKSK